MGRMPPKPKISPAEAKPAKSAPAATPAEKISPNLTTKTNVGKTRSAAAAVASKAKTSTSPARSSPRKKVEVEVPVKRPGPRSQTQRNLPIEQEVKLSKPQVSPKKSRGRPRTTPISKPILNLSEDESSDEDLLTDHRQRKETADSKVIAKSSNISFHKPDDDDDEDGDSDDYEDPHIDDYPPVDPDVKGESHHEYEETTEPMPLSNDIINDRDETHHPYSDGDEDETHHPYSDGDEDETHHLQSDGDETHYPHSDGDGPAGQSHSQQEETSEENEKNLNEGRNVFAMMSPGEIQELLDRIDKQCSPLERVSWKSKENTIDWQEVSFSSYGPSNCENVWKFLRMYIRKYRILTEVVSEVKSKFTKSKTYQTKLIESMPGFPKKHPGAKSGVHYFNREKWEKIKSDKSKEELPNFIKLLSDCKQEFKNMPTSEKERYEELSQMALATYKREVKEFYAKNPGLASFTAKMQEEEAKEKGKLEEARKLKRRATDAAKRLSKKASTFKTPQEKKPRPRPKVSKLVKLPNPYEDAPRLPQTPTVLFLQSKLNKLDPPPSADDLPALKSKYVDKWKKLSDDRKLRWIDYCLLQCSEYLTELEQYQKDNPGYVAKKGLKVRQIISKDELSLWEIGRGKPPNPKQSVFDIFYEEYLKSEDIPSDFNESQCKEEALKKWEHLDWYHKEMYRMKYKISMVEYKRNIQVFFEDLPLFMREWAKLRIHKKFWKMLNEVDKVPVEDEVPEVSENLHDPLAEDEDNNVVDADVDEDAEPPRKKKKKDKKKKKQKDGHSDEEQELEMTMFEEDNYPDYEEAHRPKKKKKKRKLDPEEPEMITGDVYSDSQSEYTEEEEDEHQNKSGPSRKLSSLVSSSSSVPLFQQNLSEQEKKILKASRTDKISKSVKKKSELLNSANNRAVHTLNEDFVNEHKSKKYPINSEIVQSDIFEAVQGIFDGRAHLGRDFSVYYYYAKYVATESYWIDCVNSKGIEKAALKIIKTFLSLNGYQKEIFIEQSASFYMESGYYYDGQTPTNHKLFEQLNFPGEPESPPKTPGAFYRQKMLKQMKKNVGKKYPLFSELDPDTQMYYIKKLYHETKLYMKRYDMFMNNMSPNDLVRYAIFEAKKWEIRMYSHQSTNNAIKGFTFPFSTHEVEREDVNPEADHHLGQRIHNPFAKDDKTLEKIKKYVANTKAKKKKANDSNESNDDVSDEEYIQFNLYKKLGPTIQAKDNKLARRKRLNRKIQKLEKYFYPIDDILAKENIFQPKQVRGMYASSTQTLITYPFTDKSVQTELLDNSHP